MQQKNKFDKESLVKIGKGALIAATGAAGLFILNALGTIEFSNPVLTSFLAWFIPFGVNLIKEYIKGERSDT